MYLFALHFAVKFTLIICFSATKHPFNHVGYASKDIGIEVIFALGYEARSDMASVYQT
jgi:hypothetical protein